VRALDVGSKDFCYATALHRWLRHGHTGAPRAVQLDGIEIDGHPVYRDGYARADHAEAYAREAGDGVRYRVEDFLASADRNVDVVLFCYPFVLRYALRRWGLPGRHFAPESLFRRAADALRPGGLLVVVNHTQEEHRRLREILAAVPGLTVLRAAPVTSAMVDYHDTVTERVMTLARRSADDEKD
jgi:SAM-dependent methyltransferase